MNLKVSVIIPARYGSKRLPGKPLISLAGRALILHVLDRAKEIEGVSQVIVATDDSRIQEIVTSEGEQAVMTPEDLASGSDRVGWVARNVNCDVVVNLQGDEPLIDAEAVSNAVNELAEDPSVPVATLGYPLTREGIWKDPNIVKILTDDQKFALYFSRQPIPFFRNGKFQSIPVLYQHLGVYVFRRNFLLDFISWPEGILERAEKLEQLRILEKGFKIKVVTSESPSFGVDTPVDVDRIEKMLKKRGYKFD